MIACLHDDGAVIFVVVHEVGLAERVSHVDLERREHVGLPETKVHEQLLGASSGVFNGNLLEEHLIKVATLHRAQVYGLWHVEVHTERLQNLITLDFTVEGHVEVHLEEHLGSLQIGCNFSDLAVALLADLMQVERVARHRNIQVRWIIT